MSGPILGPRTPPLWNRRWYLRLLTPAGIVVLLSLSGLLTLTAPVSGAAPGAPMAVPTGHGPEVLQSGAQLQHGPFSTQPNTAFPGLSPGTIVNPLPASNATLFTVGFQMRNPAALTNIINAQSNPLSSSYHHWLSLSQEQAEFGADPTVVANTINYFTSLGFKVETQSLLSVSFRGTVALTDAAFKTNLMHIVFKNGTSVSANQQPLSLPTSIAAGVASVNGLSAQSQAHTTLSINPLMSYPISTTPGVAQPMVTPEQVGPAAPPGAKIVNISALYNFTNHAFAFVHWYSFNAKKAESIQVVTPGALSTVYDALPLVNAGYNGNSTGKPITIAIVMAGGINPDDMRTYSQEVWNNPNNILNRLSVIPIDGAYGLNGTLFYTDGGSNEMALDIEYSSTMAPGAHILAVYGPGLFTTVLDDDYAALENLPTAQLPSIISNSWGGSEDSWSGGLEGASWDNTITMHSYIALLTARGASVIASSGDGGGFDGTTGMLAGSYPATDPYILSVNGLRTVVAGPDGNPYENSPTIGWTNISLVPGTTETKYEARVSTTTQMLSESYWYVPFSNYTLLRAPPEASGGFGISQWFNQSWWQHGPTMPALGRSLGSGVSAEADFNESIFFDGNWEFEYGGTSFACPTTAGIFALVLDYLAHHGQGRFLGNLNGITTLVGNAWLNGNLSLTPYYDVLNGTSFWGNQGVTHGWSWPPGQKFPYNAYGPVYGNATKAWDFPTGWGTVLVNNFAIDLSQLLGLQGNFQTATSNGLNWNPSAWANLALNGSYVIHVNATAGMQAANPKVTLIFYDKTGLPQFLHPVLNPAGIGSGYEFTLNTAISPFDSPGYLVFEFGTSTNQTMGFDYDWVAQDISPTGHLAVSVVTPGTSYFPGGDTIYNAYLGWVGNIYVYMDGFRQPYANTFTVLVTDDGVPVYNAAVTATIPSFQDIAWEGSTGAQRTAYRGSLGSAIQTNVMSATYSNTAGQALVNTINVVRDVTTTITATYGPLSATTSYTITPMPNVKAVDVDGGNYSSFNFVRYLLTYFHEPTTPQWQNIYVPNSFNQSSYYSMLYAWQGEQMTVSVNNYTGGLMPGMNVWLGNWDIGASTRFVTYEPSFGDAGLTNVSGTANTTGTSGSMLGKTTIYVPDNQTAPVGFNFNGGPYAGTYAGLDFLAVSLPNFQNRTFSYSEPCAQSALQPTPLISCQYNNSFQRNYTTVPVVVFPDPISAWTQTSAGAVRDFFGSGTDISWGATIKLPNNDPFLSGPGTNWDPGLEHITSVYATVDGIPAGTLPINQDGNPQFWSMFGNLSGNYSPGIHTLVVYATDSMGHTFTLHHEFVVGGVTYTDLPPSQVYSSMPFNLTWNLSTSGIPIPSNEISNRTFSMSLDIKYVTSGCGGPIFVCPDVVNLSIPIHPGQESYSQNINRTLLIKDGFYTGAGDLPPGQYELTVWLNANHSGSVSTQATTYLVFDPLGAQIDGPAANAAVPIGNLTISYSYTGQYVTNAILSVYAKGNPAPVFQVGAFVPGLGARGGAATWTSVQAGTYAIVLNLTTPYQLYQTTQWINVTTAGSVVYFNGTSGHQPLAGLPPVMTATILAVAAAVIGLLLGALIAAPVRNGNGRNGNGGPPSGAVGATSPKGPAKPWEDSSANKDAATSGNVCSVCKERFETPFALAQHAKIVHGFED